MFVCSYCDAQTLKWAGRCLECGKWGTLADDGESSKSSGKNGSKKKSGARAADVICFDEVSSDDALKTATGIEELDRVLGGGVVSGQVILLAGEPGIGKSTLLAQVASSASGDMLYVAGEESPSQLKLRFDRLGSDGEKVKIVTATEVEGVVSAIEKIEPSLVIVDSIQTITTREHDSIAGAPTHLRAATAQLASIAKSLGVPVVIVGQVTKDGSIAGPKMIEHMVDTVLSFTGDPRHAYRLLRATKHRFGAVDEVGVFEMTSKGLVGVESPSSVFLGEGSGSGTAVTCTMEGVRPFLLEIQALVNETSYATPARRGSGFSANRMGMLLAILEKHGKMRFSGDDVYVNVTGGMKINEPAADLAVCAALISSKLDKTLTRDSVFFGEVGLGGEVRSVPMLENRVKESKRLGYTHVVCNQDVKSIGELVNFISKM